MATQKTGTAPKRGSLEWQCSQAGAAARRQDAEHKQLKAENAELRMKIRAIKQTQKEG